jgi:hypothetical protein
MLCKAVFTYLALSAGAVSAFAPPHSPYSLAASSTTRMKSSSSDIVDHGRRAFLASSFITLVGISPEVAHAKGKNQNNVDYKAVAGDISNIIKGDPNKGPTLVRLAWHSSGTYDKMSKDGGSGGGTIRFKEELAHGGNAGLGVTAVPWLEDVKKKYGDSLSYADLYTLAGGKLHPRYWNLLTTTNVINNSSISDLPLLQLLLSKNWADQQFLGGKKRAKCKLCICKNIRSETNYHSLLISTLSPLKLYMLTTAQEGLMHWIRQQLHRMVACLAPILDLLVQIPVMQIT